MLERLGEGVQLAYPWAAY